MQTIYQAGDRVTVYDTPGNRARAEHGDASVSGRKAVVAREHASEPGTYEVAYKDGSEPASALVTAEYLMPAAK